jgi:hypothetical protein
VFDGVGVTDGVCVAVGTGVLILTTASSPQPTNVTDAKEISNDTNNNAAQIVINHFFI